MKYKGIKKILRKQIEENKNLLWQWDKDNNNFICIYHTVDNTIPIYTPIQLLNVLTDLKQDKITTPTN